MRRSLFAIAAFILVFALSSFTFAAERNSMSSKQPATPQNSSTQPYSGNVKSLKFHSWDCKHYRCRTCTRFFNTKEEAVAAGYNPCGWCQPQP